MACIARVFPPGPVLRVYRHSHQSVASAGLRRCHGLRLKVRSDSSEDAWDVEVDDWTYSEEFREQQLIDTVEQVLPVTSDSVTSNPRTYCGSSLTSGECRTKAACCSVSWRSA